MLTQTDILKIKKQLDKKESLLKDLKKFKLGVSNGDEEQLRIFTDSYCDIRIPLGNKFADEMVKLAEKYIKSEVDAIDWDIRKHGVSASIQPKEK